MEMLSIWDRELATDSEEGFELVYFDAVFDSHSPRSGDVNLT